ncbi:MAG: biotin/lipoyl-containing protein [Lutibacter sp.]|jgi:biotin carboxyl carrier protein|nr:biotin/lipoyl-containing protein [Lutibacter sp.]
MKNFKFRIHENNYIVKIISHEEDIIELEVNGTSYSVKMKEGNVIPKTPTMVLAKSRKPIEPFKVNPGSGKTKILAPIPGVIMSIDIKVGDTIKVGDRLLVLEAMKMENNITSEQSGTVSAIHVKAGQQVLQSELMVELT